MRTAHTHLLDNADYRVRDTTARATRAERHARVGALRRLLYADTTYNNWPKPLLVQRSHFHEYGARTVNRMCVQLSRNLRAPQRHHSQRNN